MRIVLFASAMWLCVPPAARADNWFRDQVAPIFEQHCLACHGADEPKGGLSLAEGRGALAGGDSGQVIAPGDPEASLLVDYVSGDPPLMPKQGSPLDERQVAAIRQWIGQGARWPADLKLVDKRFEGQSWWSLEPLKRPQTPAVTAPAGWPIRTPIDAFVLAELNRQQLGPSPQADRRTIIRRLTYNLHGLPPTAEEIEAFESDRAPEAYERLVDRLLASPRYGERWARHWLDLVHFGETHGYDKDKTRENAWPYRDYVVQSLNEDKPYSLFVSEQLAGDVLYPHDPDALAATGLIAAGPWDFVGHVELREGTTDKVIARSNDRDDMLMTTVSTFLSVTAHCARCHDHKFDPIPQADYYRLQAVFAGVDRADRPYYRDPELQRQFATLTSQRQLLAARQRVLDEKLAGLEMALLDDATRSELEEVRRQTAEVQDQLASLPPPDLVYAAATEFAPQANFAPAGGCRPIYLLHRGNVASRGDLMAPGALSCLPWLEHHFQLERPEDEGSRRAALARWITDPANPLTRRSIVNRVWQYHFGRGLVDTPSDFGRMGSQPTHPELLDWLATEFLAGGESLKRLHRLILTSSAYRQSSAGRADGQRIDAGNRYLWRMNRARLDAESVRDAALFVAGKLDQAMGGPSARQFVFKDDHSPVYDYERFDVEQPGSFRRGVYRFIVRSVPDPFMDCLDSADPSILTPQRNTTLTALQALTMLNNPFMLSQSRHFARRLEGGSADPVEQVRQGWLLALGRPPRSGESEAFVAYAKRHGLANACRLILNSNEFLFVD